MKPMQSLLPLFAILLCACADTSYPRSELQIDDADAWQAICKDGVRVRAVTDEGICADHRGGPCGQINQGLHGWQKKRPSSVTCTT